MSKKEEHKTKKLIQSIDLDSPSVNFTDKVMSKVNAIADDEVLKDVVLTSLLQKNSLESPALIFSSKVMAKVNKKTSEIYTPVISKKAWKIILLVFGSLIAYVLLSKPTQESTSPYLSEFTTLMDKFTSAFSTSLVENANIPSIFILSVLGLTILLVIDFSFRAKKISL